MWSCPPTRAGHVSAQRRPSERRTEALRVSLHPITPSCSPALSGAPAVPGPFAPQTLWLECNLQTGSSPWRGAQGDPKLPRTGLSARAWPQDRGQGLETPQGRGQGLETPQDHGQGLELPPQGSGQGLETPPQGSGQGLETPASAPSRPATRRVWEWLEGPSPESGVVPLRGPLP